MLRAATILNWSPYMKSTSAWAHCFSGAQPLWQKMVQLFLLVSSMETAMLAKIFLLIKFINAVQTSLSLSKAAFCRSLQAQATSWKRWWSAGFEILRLWVIKTQSCISESISLGKSLSSERRPSIWFAESNWGCSCNPFEGGVILPNCLRFNAQQWMLCSETSNNPKRAVTSRAAWEWSQIIHSLICGSIWWKTMKAAGV